MRKLPQVTPGEVPSGGFRSLDPEDRLDGWIIGTIELGSWLIPREGGSTLRDSPEALLLEADLPALPLSDPKALDEIASGTLSGLSIEFHATQESRDGEIRVVEKADLAGIGLVASPSYPASRVETRAAGTLSTSIPYDSLPCMRVLRPRSVGGGWERDDSYESSSRKDHLSCPMIS